MSRTSFGKNTARWFRQQGPGYPFALSCRARIARNIEGLPFPSAACDEDLERVRGMVLETVSRRVAEERDWDILFAEELSREELGYMAEEHYTSTAFGERVSGRAIAMNWRAGTSVVVNEEDHLRIQAVLSGAQLEKVWCVADRIDDGIEAALQYSFDEKLGYLTSCPSNVGTGLRISAMLHMPALVTTGEIGRTVSALGIAGVYVRGLHGEGSGVAGNLFQISNRKTLGESEKSIWSRMETVVHQVIDKERTARKMMERDAPLDLSDRVYRSLGVLERARKLSYYEALELISMVKLGVEMELIPMEDFNILEVALGASPYHVRRLVDDDASEEEVDRERAIRVRRMLEI